MKRYYCKELEKMDLDAIEAFHRIKKNYVRMKRIGMYYFGHDGKARFMPDNNHLNESTI